MILQLLRVVSDKPPAVPPSPTHQQNSACCHKHFLVLNVNTFHKIVFIPLFTVLIVQVLIVNAHVIIKQIEINVFDIM